MRAGALPAQQRGEGWLRASHTALELLLLVRPDELHVAFCGIVTLAAHFSGLGGCARSCRVPKAAVESDTDCKWGESAAT